MRYDRDVDGNSGFGYSSEQSVPHSMPEGLEVTAPASATGDGAGTVTSSPSGIECGTDCSELYPSGTTVTLTATPASGSVFAGWSGCDEVSGASCTVTMNAAASVTARFDLKRFALMVRRSGLGSGTVTSSPSGIVCGADCSQSYVTNTTVTLTARPALGSIFIGWSGCDAVSGARCMVTMRADRSVTASFLGLPFGLRSLPSPQP